MSSMARRWQSRVVALRGQAYTAPVRVPFTGSASWGAPTSSLGGREGGKRVGDGGEQVQPPPKSLQLVLGCRARWVPWGGGAWGELGLLAWSLSHPDTPKKWGQPHLRSWKGTQRPRKASRTD